MEKSESTFIEDLIQLCHKNADHYEKDASENGQRMRLGFLSLIENVTGILPLVANIEKIMSEYDFDEHTPGNGYRSFVVIVNASFKHAFELCNYVAINKDSIIFRKGFYVKEIEAISHMIASLASCFQHLQTLLGWSDAGELFPSAEHYSEVLLQQSGNINQYAFYGRCLGIQFRASVQPLLKLISIFMASFSEIYYNIGSFSAKAQGFVSGGKFLLDPELRAQRIVNISQHATIDFCKSFWFLTESELMKKIPDFICSSVAVNTEIKIPPEPLQINDLMGNMVEIPIPSSHIPINSIQVRLLSSSRREGMIAVWSEVNKKNKIIPSSRSLILHCHGGGFVAQSSKSHEVYLRDWASNLDVPIVSIDYSLAPEAPFPRALEEVFYSYCWVLKNSHVLGSTGENIVLAGDSAGANLILGVALKCVEYNIRRPNGLFVAYVPVIVSSTPSPSRLLCLMDPLLPIGFLLRCLKAYACPDLEVDEKGIPAEEYKVPEPQSTVDSNCICDEMVSDVKQDGKEIPELNSTSKELNLVEPGCDISRYNDGSFRTVNAGSIEYCEPELAVGLREIPEGSASSERNYKNAFNSVKKKVSSLVTNTFKLESKNIDKALMGTDTAKPNCPQSSFKDLKFSVPRDPYLSPYWAPDDMLKQLPPTSICSVEFDPCLDDCVMFAKKLKKLGNVVTLDILEGLPHGFLNLSKVNKDAEQGSRFCIQRIKELLARTESSWKNCNDENENLDQKNGLIVGS